MPESPREHVDAEFRRILKLLNGPAYTPVHELTPAEARAQAEYLFQGPSVQVVGSQEDLVAQTPAGDIPCRFYHPRPGERLPLLVYYHGGGWVLGNLQSIHGVTASLAARSGCAVLSVDYRLAPEHPFPAAVEDAMAALVWAADSSERLSIDSTRIAVGVTARVETWRLSFRFWPAIRAVPRCNFNCSSILRLMLPALPRRWTGLPRGWFSRKKTCSGSGITTAMTVRSEKVMCEPHPSGWRMRQVCHRLTVCLPSWIR